MTMPPNCERYRTRAEWLVARGIGGSDLAIILNQSKWGTLDELYDRLTGKPQKDDKQSDRMREGSVTEQSIRTLFAFDMKDEYKVIEPPKRGNWIWRRADEKLISVSPDGILKRKSDGAFGGLEIKNVELRSSEDIALWEGNSLPPQYYWQCIQYMLAIPELRFVILYAHLKRFSEIGGEWRLSHCEDRPYVIYREDAETSARISVAERAEKAFIERYVRKGVRPPLRIKI